MRYYAVTNDPSELMHYGIKGMKWGVIRTDAQLGHPKKPSKPRSAAYRRASGKLSSMMRNGIAKAETKWAIYNSPENKEIRAYNRAVKRDIRQNKHAEKMFQKHVQLARQGRLKYKGISDDEVVRINNRLALENMARNQSGKENPSFVRRVRESVASGIVQGVGQGTSGYISARMTGRGQTTAQIKKEKRMAAYHNSLTGRIADAREFRRDKREAKREGRVEATKDFEKKYYQAVNEEGYTFMPRTKGARRDIVNRHEELERQRKLEDSYYTEMNKAYAKRNTKRLDDEYADERKLSEPYRLVEQNYAKLQAENGQGLPRLPGEGRRAYNQRSAQYKSHAAAIKANGTAVSQAVTKPKTFTLKNGQQSAIPQSQRTGNHISGKVKGKTITQGTQSSATHRTIVPNQQSAIPQSQPITRAQIRDAIAAERNVRTSQAISDMERAKIHEIAERATADYRRRQAAEMKKQGLKELAYQEESRREKERQRLAKTQWAAEIDRNNQASWDAQYRHDRDVRIAARDAIRDKQENDQHQNEIAKRRRQQQRALSRGSRSWTTRSKGRR